MIAVAPMLNSLSLNHDKLFIWPTPRQTVSHIPDKQFVTEPHGCGAFLLSHIVTWYQNTTNGSSRSNKFELI